MCRVRSLVFLAAFAQPLLAMPHFTERDTTSSSGKLLGSSFGSGGNATFDYIVVGGGTAGLVVATRLAEDPNTSVAVIEAGNFYEISNGIYSQVPLFGPLGSGKSPYDTAPLVDWQFVTEPQEVSNAISPLRQCKLTSVYRECLVPRCTMRVENAWAAAPHEIT